MDQLADAVARCRRSPDGHLRPVLAFGCGRSYGDACLSASDRVICLRGLDRILAADWEQGRVRAQAGLTIADLLDIALPRGWFPAVTPGTKFVTLGGAVANDVHGKNHHRAGTFGCHVTRLCLYRTDTGFVECDRTDALFAATIGGLGLTGIIVWVELQLKPVRSPRLQQSSTRFPNLASFFDLSAAGDARHEYSVAWVDCSTGGGRGHYVAADHVDRGGAAAVRRRTLRIPFELPISLVNALSVRLFNAAYYRRQGGSTTTSDVDYETFFYPLDRVQNWNLVYGRNGFQQYQCVVPQRQAAAAIPRLLDMIVRSRAGSSLTVLKRCGPAESPGLMSFPLDGTSLALDFPQHDRLGPLFDALDDLVHRAGGRLYPAKDAHMQREHFQQGYPRWRQVEQQRDPALMSRFWQRVTQRCG